MLFGTIKNFDEIKGVGSIQPENGNAVLHFEKSAVTWGEARDSKDGSPPVLRDRQEPAGRRMCR